MSYPHFDGQTPMCGMPCGCIRTQTIHHTCEEHKPEAEQ